MTKMITGQFLCEKQELLNVKFIGIDCYNATAQPNEAIAARFLKRLIKRLQKKYKQNVIVWIDDFDAPLNHAFRMGFYEKTSSFFAEF
jgi:Predicted AAA-ATPase